MTASLCSDIYYGKRFDNDWLCIGSAIRKDFGFIYNAYFYIY